MSGQMPARLPVLTSAPGQYSKGWIMTLAAVCIMGTISLANAEENTTTPDKLQTQNTEASSQEIQAQENTQRGVVSRAIFTSQIVDREPADNLTEMSNDTQRIYFFTDLRKLEGQIVTHRWEYNGKTMAEVKFKVGSGPRWRVFSSKNLLPEWTGEWTVIVTDESGWTLKAGVFEYTQAATENEAVMTPTEEKISPQ